MKRLILMRHAKAATGAVGLDDHARALSGRGRSSARMLGDWLRARGRLPDVALVSDAARTRETFSRLGLACDVRFLAELYLADPDAMLHTLRQARGACVLMIGHNPGIGWLARALVAEPPPHPRFFDYPTGATLIAEVDVAKWADLGTGTARALDFIIPRELTG
ncbi:MAG: histidine phosphatase family protein [Roseovarius sp.]|nr:histidine phosphatase family protein [Roseovarius sp.]